jgi:hypothetical protein
MTYETWTPDYTSVDRGHSFRKTFFEIVYGPFTLLLCILLGGVILYTFVTSHQSDAPADGAAIVVGKARRDGLNHVNNVAPTTPHTTTASAGPYGMLFDPSFTANLEPVPLDQNRS